MKKVCAILLMGFPLIAIGGVSAYFGFFKGFLIYAGVAGVFAAFMWFGFKLWDNDGRNKTTYM